MLAAERLFEAGLPGCGAGSGCAAAAASPFARVGRVPVAYVGLAYVAAVAMAWGLSGRTAVALWWVRAGAVASAGFLVIIAEHRLWCSYCLAAHACNLGLWALLERAPRAAGALWPALALVVGFGGVLGAVAVIKPLAVGYRFQASQRKTEALIEEVVAAADGGEWLPVPAEGGIRVGPADARVRITVFLDYQCPYCREVARSVGAMAGRPGVAITWRQMPHGSPCDGGVKQNRNPHACRAARLAAAASAGPTGAFERAHEWLLGRGGRCADEDIEDALPSLEVGDERAFWARFHAARTREAVRADVKIAVRLGVTATPAVFVNGVRLHAWDLGQAAQAAVEASETTLAAE